MARSTRFAVAIHILVSLGLRDERLSSEGLAWSIDTNPSMVRRILGSLKKAGLVHSQPGAAGGAELAADPARITLLDVFRAVALSPASGVHRANPECPLGAVIDEPLRAVLDEAARASEQVLASKTLLEVSEAVRRQIVRRARKKPVAARTGR